MKPFGTTKDGQTVHSLQLGAAELSVTLLTWGAVVQDVRLTTVPYSLTLGSDRLADYEEAMPFHGALIGPVVNRLRDARARIGDKVLELEANEDGRHLLHSGKAGTHRKVWNVVDSGPAQATLTLTLPDGEGGFPGNREITARYELVAPATLRLTVTGKTDALTLMNVANHSYWNLDGSDRWDGHRLRIAADHMLPADPDSLPTGEMLKVTDTPFDFRDTRTVAVGDPLLDNNFCLSESPVALRDVLWLTGRSGVGMTIATTAPGMQVYDGRAGIRPGHASHEGLAIEAQNWPDAPNNPAFPSIELAAGVVYSQITEWRFSTP